MTKVVFVPLDERPCNYLFPQMLAEMTNLNLVVPEKSMLGKKKEPANFKELKEWLITESVDSEYLIISIDMLLYGGIVPSRLHHITLEECITRMEVLREIKDKNPSIKIYGFNLIMRTPSYNNNDEEPDYYSEFGERIFTYGWLSDKQEKGLIAKDERVKLEEIETEIPKNILKDFLQRRKINHQMNHQSIEFVHEGIMDHLVVPLDDNSPYGFTSKEQKSLMLKVEQLNLVEQVLIYPGADEVGCTLLAKVFTRVNHYYPEIYVRYSSTKGPFIIPRLEDRTLNESIKSQLTAVNAFMADNSMESDCVLMVNSPAIGGDLMADGKHEGKHHSYYSEVNHREFIHAISHYLRKEKMVALADVAVINGADHQLLKILSKKGILEKIEAYAGWNTSGNTIGTVIAHAVIHSYYRNDSSVDQSALEKSKNFYLYRLMEDWGYQSIVRQQVTEEELPALDANYFDIKDVKLTVTGMVQEKLREFSQEFLEPNNNFEIVNIDLPWNRMFEVDFKLKR